MLKTLSTDDAGKFNVSLEPCSYTVSLKHAEKVAPDTFKPSFTIDGARGTKGTIKWFPIAELEKGVTLEIQVAGKGPSTITVTCIATRKGKGAGNSDVARAQ